MERVRELSSSPWTLGNPDDLPGQRNGVVLVDKTS